VVSLLRDKKCGRPKEIDEQTRNLILELYWTRNLALRKIANYTGVSAMTVWREVNSQPLAR
jgi:hypothetical protein